MPILLASKLIVFLKIINNINKLIEIIITEKEINISLIKFDIFKSSRIQWVNDFTKLYNFFHFFGSFIGSFLGVFF